MAVDATTKMMLWPGQDTKSDTFRVTDTPIRVIGRVPEGARVVVWRMYDNTGDDCEFVVDPIPVMCCDSCDQLGLFNQPYADCYTGFLKQYEVVIRSSGLYYLEYCCAPEEIIPPLEPVCATVANFTARIVAVDQVYFEMTEVANGLDLTNATLADFTIDGQVAATAIAPSGINAVIVTFPEADLDIAASFEYTDSGAFSIVGVDNLYTLCDFTQDITPPPAVTCAVVDGIQETTEVLRVNFNNVADPDFDSANLTDFVLVGGGTKSPVSIDYSNPGYILLDFGEYTLFDSAELTYIATDLNILSFNNATCEVQDFVITTVGEG